jgi:CheY-like chemotaxis protein
VQVDLKSILIIDDDGPSLEVYCHLLRERTNAKVVSAKYPSVGLKLAEKQFFDFVLVDVTMNFRGSMFGGLEVYKALLPRYGAASIIVYSQFVTDELLKEFDFGNFNFYEKGSSHMVFIEEVIRVMQDLRKRQFCFVALPFAPQYEPIFQCISECSISCGFLCQRIDQASFNDSIVQRIFEGIRDSKFVVFVASGKNPNVYYECGYAVALKKEVVTLTDRHENLPFDIRDRQAVAYGDDLENLKVNLLTKLKTLTNVSID